MSPSEFISEVLHFQLKTKYLSVGPDWAFGRDRAGDLILLKEMSHRYGYQMEVVEPVVIGDTVVSSTSIRDFLASGDVGRAADFLGRPFSVYGRISEEDHSASEEENPRPFFIEVDADKIIPPDGAYRLELKTPQDPTSRATVADCCIGSSYGEDGKRISISPLGGDFQSFKGKWSREVEIRFREKI
jgi:riboflavin kinase/FMN adenylyltransferase